MIPKPEATTSDGLHRFVAEVTSVAPDAGGSAVTIVGSADTIVDAFRTAALLALAAIAVLLLVALRHLLDVALVMAPLLVSAMLTVLLAVLLPLPLNFANIIALPLLLGVGVSFNVYFVMNWRARKTLPLGSATARAVLFSALTTSTAFGSLALSPHPGTASMGQLLLLSLGCTLLTTMLFLPALAGLGRHAGRAEGAAHAGARARQAPPAEAARMSALPGVRALVFDVFGTVVDWRGGVAREAAPFLAAYAPGADPVAFADAWRKQYQPAMDAVRRGERPFTRLDVLHRENLEAILPAFEIDQTRVPAAELDELNLAWHRLDPWPDVVAGLTRLKRGFIIAPLSNGNIVLMLDIAKRAGLPWDAILGAEVSQAYKPMPQAYLRTAEVLAIQPGQLCLVAAHNSDLAAARQCGLRTAFVARPQRAWSGPDHRSASRAGLGRGRRGLRAARRATRRLDLPSVGRNAATAASSGRMVTSAPPCHCSRNGRARMFWPFSSNLAPQPVAVVPTGTSVASTAARTLSLSRLPARCTASKNSLPPM